MLDVRVGGWTALEAGSGAAVTAAALKAAAAALAAAAPKKGAGAAWRSKKGGHGGGSDASAAETTPLDPAAPAVRALAYRMPPDWGDGWLTKRAFSFSFFLWVCGSL
jgi:hypothetical protein